MGPVAAAAPCNRGPQICGTPRGTTAIDEAAVFAYTRE
jgi:hypothetical protein